MGKTKSSHRNKAGEKAAGAAHGDARYGGSRADAPPPPREDDNDDETDGDGDGGCGDDATAPPVAARCAERAIRIAMWEFGQNDPKRDSGSKLVRASLARAMRPGQPFGGVVLSSEASTVLSPADLPLMVEVRSATRAPAAAGDPRPATAHSHTRRARGRFGLVHVRRRDDRTAGSPNERAGARPNAPLSR